ncbi:helix-turn-helix transcriptional regulator [Beutenbergia cavernae]|uniref:helix-turn-helix transcriptional regulator n=1 Tax=Beutenbergia cavernae TaxID=84757 RepID=UPI00019AD308|nr:AraC family transcriptional regulator [Beutenbergia cavernae]
MSEVLVRDEAVTALRRARDLADSRYADEIDVDTLAASAGYSRYHFSRLFRRVYGETPGQYLSRRRVERAQQILSSTNLTVTEVCHLVGFTSLGSFSSRFRALVGVGPQEYQRRKVAEGVPPIPGCFLLLAAGLPTADRTTADRTTADRITARVEKQTGQGAP